MWLNDVAIAYGKILLTVTLSFVIGIVGATLWAVVAAHSGYDGNVVFDAGRWIIAIPTFIILWRAQQAKSL